MTRGPSLSAAVDSLVEEPGTTVRRYVSDAERRVNVARLRLRLGHGRPAPERSRETARRALTGADRVLFLCHGNVHRSPMAEAYLRDRLADRGVADVTVESAGFLDAEGRPSPETARMTARAYDVDLSGHRSRRVRGAQLEDSDAVFVMDAYNLYHLRAEFPDLDPPTFLLAGVGLARDEGLEIPDPHAEGVPGCLAAYRILVPAVDWLVDVLADRREAATPAGARGGERRRGLPGP